MSLNIAKLLATLSQSARDQKLLARGRLVSPDQLHGLPFTSEVMPPDAWLLIGELHHRLFQLLKSGGQALLFAPVAVLPAPVFAPGGGHLQVEGFFIGQADAGAPFGASGLLARCVGQGHFGGTFQGASEKPDLCPRLCPPKIAASTAR